MNLLSSIRHIENREDLSINIEVLCSHWQKLNPYWTTIKATSDFQLGLQLAEGVYTRPHQFQLVVEMFEYQHRNGGPFFEFAEAIERLLHPPSKNPVYTDSEQKVENRNKFENQCKLFARGLHKACCLADWKQCCSGTYFKMVPHGRLLKLMPLHQFEQVICQEALWFCSFSKLSREDQIRNADFGEGEFLSEDERNHTFSCSFYFWKESPPSDPVWKIYTDGHKGVALEIDPQAFARTTLEIPTRAREIVSDEHEIVYDSQSARDQGIHFGFLKKRPYNTESEYRLLFKDVMPLRSTQAVGGVPVKLDLPAVVKHIVFGKLTSKEEIIKLIKGTIFECIPINSVKELSEYGY